MFQGKHGRYDFDEAQWFRNWKQPAREDDHIREAFTLIRDQTVYRKLAGDTTPITVLQLVRASGLNVGRWLDRYDCALQILSDNLWIVYEERQMVRQRYISEKHLRCRHQVVDPHDVFLSLSGRCLSMSKLPSVDHVMQELGEGLLRHQR